MLIIKATKIRRSLNEGITDAHSACAVERPADDSLPWGWRAALWAGAFVVLALVLSGAWGK